VLFQGQELDAELILSRGQEVIALQPANRTQSREKTTKNRVDAERAFIHVVSCLLPMP